MNNGEEDVCVCPSFNSYSSGRLAEIAIRVAGNRPSDAAGNEVSGGDDDFEFALVREDKEVSSAEFFCSGPVFPVFNRDLIENGFELSTSGGSDQPESKNLVPLSKLFAEEDDDERDSDPPSCSSSEADELENIPAGTYCVWRPRMSEPPLPSQCKKSKSTGSASKRWKLRDLLRRSKSDGKESFVFLTPKHREEKSEKLAILQAPKKGNGKGMSQSSAAVASPSAHEAFYVRNRAMKEGDKRKSYLPYRRDLVGFFANVNGVRRSFSHF
ncbi:hypothetical protein C2S53_015676 [Perilla frutescens var. hirtella]|uniref:Uncharacterized protein n=1 Tax=Perilla frutescens var. hirtella TaxID=608512 RepID=A0AAD4J8U2_PERFH|nr:hypothetical protein C2S53_015676 [Perilla frutescens var. hirtella]